MDSQNRLIFGLIFPVLIFIISLYSLWIIEFFKVVNAPVSISFRDPKDLGLLYDLFAPIIYYTSPISFVLAPFFGVLIYNWQMSGITGTNPLSAFTWFLD